ncbi:FAD-dependent oxidoreductase [Haloferula sp.]|uniref:FAD-dependent oxidoreductase n=1 Tax=Haloferula sp. TaxID=2497595 RepID=UPI003C767A93
MNRRHFVRIVGGLAFTAGTAPRYAFGAEGRGASGVLVEACGFDDPGGWSLDTQFYQQMGGCFLLAHGMGIPVANARTVFNLPAPGKWRVWVRTRDWCPGEWQSPGRFRVKIDGEALETVFGTEDGWAWQAGGEIEVDQAGTHSLELEDLTGFDGRCDAVFFTQEEAPDLPSENLPELAVWKDRLSGREQQTIGEEDYDVVIVGAGLSGCGAALAARSQGLRVALIQDRPILGGNASEEIRVHTLGIHGKDSNFLKQIDTEHYPNGDAKAALDQKKREKAMKDSGVEIFAHHIAIGLGMEGERITSVEAREVTSGRIRRFLAPVFIDATGDGWLGIWAGADYREGREAAGEFDEAWDKHGDLWSPEEPDKRVMGTSVLWNSTRAKQASRFPEVPWAMPVAGRHTAINGEWYWEYSAPDLDQVKDAEQIRDHMLRAIFGSFANAKKQPKNATVQLEWVAYVGGKRESRRLMGDYIYTMKDATERRTFPDVVVEEERELDAHYQRAETGAPEDFLSKAIFRKTGGVYYIPFRCFYSRNIPNLMMAGRCFSCSHIGLSGPRVMNTCGQMGIATGYAASLCKKHGVLPREVGDKHVTELKKLIGYQA